MKYLKQPDGTVCVFESNGSEDDRIGADMVPLDSAEIQEYLEPTNTPPPSKEQLVDGLLASKGVTRLLVQLTIEVSEDKAKALAASYDMTEAQALAYAYSKNKTYRECKDLEAAIRAVETAP